jgi:nitroreductase
MDLERAIYSRRAVRGHTADPVDDATIRRLIDTAREAPCAINPQPWIFSVDWLASDEGKAAVGVPRASAPVAPIIVGHPQYEPAPTPRRETDIIWIG